MPSSGTAVNIWSDAASGQGQRSNAACRSPFVDESERKCGTQHLAHAVPSLRGEISTIGAPMFPPLFAMETATNCHVRIC